MNDQPRLGEQVAAVARGLGLAFRFAPLGAAAIALLMPFAGVIFPFIAAQVGRAIDLLPSVVAGDAGATRELTWVAVVVAVGFTVDRGLTPIIDEITKRTAGLVRRGLAGEVMDSVLRLPGLHHFEDPDTRDRLQAAGWASHGPVEMLQHPAQIIRGIFGLAGYSVLAAVGGWWIPASILIAAIPSGIVSLRYEASEMAAQADHSLDARRHAYYSGLATQLPAAQESRIFGFGGWILRRQQAAWQNTIAQVWRVRRHRLTLYILANLLVMLVAGVGYIVLLRATLRGDLDVGAFAAAAYAVTSLTMASQVFAGFGFLRRDTAFLPDVFRVRALPDDDPRMQISSSPAPMPPRRSGLRFEGVSFTYPGTQRPVLTGLELAIDHGETVALVGLNGAGKTTLIKLLCRFYDPTEGRITIDGTDLRDLDIQEWRRRVGVIFQDFQRYPLSVRDNIGFGSPTRLTDDEVLVTAAERVGVLDKIARLPAGWDTPLARDFGGVDLSGGEWQRIALARAVAARLGTGADLLILDEPTANLDVRVEDDIYRRFAVLTEDATTILVSHRFSTVRMADRIAVLQDGSIRESGTHTELMVAGGAYAELYRAQAAHFRSEGEDPT